MQKPIKKILYAILALGLVLGLTGCTKQIKYYYVITQPKLKLSAIWTVTDKKDKNIEVTSEQGQILKDIPAEARAVLPNIENISIGTKIYEYSPDTEYYSAKNVKILDIEEMLRDPLVILNGSVGSLANPLPDNPHFMPFVGKEGDFEYNDALKEWLAIFAHRSLQVNQGQVFVFKQSYRESYDPLPEEVLEGKDTIIKVETSFVS